MVSLTYVCCVIISHDRVCSELLQAILALTPKYEPAIELFAKIKARQAAEEAAKPSVRNLPVPTATAPSKVPKLEVLQAPQLVVIPNAMSTGALAVALSILPSKSTNQDVKSKPVLMAAPKPNVMVKPPVPLFKESVVPKLAAAPSLALTVLPDPRQIAVNSGPIIPSQPLVDWTVDTVAEYFGSFGVHGSSSNPYSKYSQLVCLRRFFGCFGCSLVAV